jgi:hypothetical protein
LLFSLCRGLRGSLLLPFFFLPGTGWWFGSLLAAFGPFFARFSPRLGRPAGSESESFTSSNSA